LDWAAWYRTPGGGVMAGAPKRREGRGLPAHPWRDDPSRVTRTHPPYEEGNTMAVRSGAWSPRLITETMEELRPELQRLVDLAPWVRPLDEHALIDYLRDLARLERLERWLADHGDRYPDGHKRAGELRDRDLREVASLRRRCMDHRARLGFEPAARARLDLDRAQAVDLARAWAGEGDDEGGDGDA
jgi:hypothetical protein